MLVLTIPSQFSEVVQHVFYVMARLAMILQVLVLTGQKIKPLPVFYVFHHVKQALDRFPHLLGLYDPDFTIYEVGRVPIGDESDSTQQNKYSPKAHRNLLL